MDSSVMFSSVRLLFWIVDQQQTQCNLTLLDGVSWEAGQEPLHALSLVNSNIITRQGLSVNSFVYIFTYKVIGVYFLYIKSYIF